MSPLRKWRGDRTLDDCAALFDTTTATLSRLERGDQWISRELTERIAFVTGLTFDEILGCKSKPKRRESTA